MKAAESLYYCYFYTLEIFATSILRFHALRVIDFCGSWLVRTIARPPLPALRLIGKNAAHVEQPLLSTLPTLIIKKITPVYHVV